MTSTSTDGDVLWPLADNLGSVRDIVESDGTVANHITYDGYGNVTSEYASSVEHIFGFTGRDRDEESDLQYNRARYYDADRQPDPDGGGSLAAPEIEYEYDLNGNLTKLIDALDNETVYATTGTIG